jgi:transposase-like protein
VCEQLRERYEQFKRRELYDVCLVALFLDSTYLAVRPDGPEEGVLVAWGFTGDGERCCFGWCSGCASTYEDRLELGRDLIARTGRAAAYRGRRRPRADQGDRAVLAGV